jgi:DNA polymerase-3 subunit alpha
MKQLEKRGRGLPAGEPAARRRPAYEVMASGQTVGCVPDGRAGDARHPAPASADSLEECTALISLYRPGPMDSIPAYVDVKMGRKRLDFYHPLSSRS